MSIVRYRQWPAQAAFQNEIKQVFDRFFDPNGGTDESAVVTAQWVPRVDIKEEPERFVLYADLPGIDPSEIEVSMDKGILSIKGERKSESAADSERFSRIERRYGSFHRRFALPEAPIRTAFPPPATMACWKCASPSVRRARRVASRSIPGPRSCSKRPPAAASPSRRRALAAGRRMAGRWRSACNRPVAARRRADSFLR